MSEHLDDWHGGMPVSARHLQQPIDVLKKLVALPGFGIHQADAADGIPTSFEVEFNIGRIVTAGPGGAADFPNELYWVQQQYIRGGLAPDPIVLADESPVLNPVSDEDLVVGPVPPGFNDPPPTVVPVTNLSELLAHTHLLPPDTPVAFLTVCDRGDPANVHRIMWVTAEDGPEFAEQVHKGVANLTAGWGLLGEANLTP